MEALALKLVALGVALTGALFSAEYLLATRRGALGPDSLLAWNIYASQPGRLYRGWPRAVQNAIFAQRPFFAVMMLRFGLSLVLPLVSARATNVTILAALLVLTLLTSARHLHGRDGADELALITLAGLLAYWTVGPTAELRFAGLIFIVAQLTLSYAVSGLAKVVSARWRSGTAIAAVLATRIYGMPAAAGLMRRKPLALALSLCLILWECSFPIFWLTPGPWAYAWLLAGVVFHLSSAVLMGLNSFLIAFLTPYPLMVYLHAQLSRLT